VSDNHAYREELEIAERAATDAGAIIMRWYGRDYRVQEKSKNNPVTTADLEANNTIREVIQKRFPQDGWLSEEDKDTDKRLACSRVWVVDPIDGTKEFIEGVPHFAVSVGFVVDGQPTAAVVYNPPEDRLYRAARGQGAYLNGEPIHVTGQIEVQGARLLVSRSEPQRKFQVFVDRCELQRVGSIANRLAKVAAGEGDGTLTFRSVHEWDVCAGALMVEEAGGRVIDGNGRRLVFNCQETRHRGIVASNEILAYRFQELWARSMAEKQ
jgi:myo-inositol-1(or 4)-monophosphatase